MWEIDVADICWGLLVFVDVFESHLRCLTVAYLSCWFSVVRVMEVNSLPRSKRSMMARIQMESKATCRKTVKHNKGRADGKETLWMLSHSTPSFRSDLVWNLCRSSCRAATVVPTLSALCWTKLHFMQNKEVKSSTRTAPWFFWLLMHTIILDISWYFWMIDVEACQCNVCILQHSYNHRNHS